MKVRINPTIFREYDIRGIVGSDLTPEVAETIVRARATYLQGSASPSPFGGEGWSEGGLLGPIISCLFPNTA